MMTKLQFSDLRDIKRGRGRGGWLAESFTVMGSLPVSFMLESRTFISQKELGISTASAACPANRHGPFTNVGCVPVFWGHFSL